jgi:tripartite-type tricarboxylate transporter receptor subunit TctC
MKKISVGVRIFFVLSFLLGFANLSWAEFPEKPIEILMPYGISSPSAAIVRVIADRMSKYLHKQVIIIAAVGAGGTMAGEKIANRTKPDGYTLVQVNSATNGMAFFTKKLNYTIDNFTYLALTHRAYLGLVAAPNAPFKTLEEYLAFAKKNPHVIKIASTGFGTSGHFFIEYLKIKGGNLKIDLTPFKTPPEVTKAVVSGVTQAAAIYGGSGGPNDELTKAVEGGARILAVTSKERLKGFPKVPSLTERGLDMVWCGWWGLGGPKGLPERVQSVLKNAIYKAVVDPQVAKVATSGGFWFDFLKQEEFIPFVKEYYKTGEMIAKEANITKQ